jgi:hypothetical protein
VNKVERAVLSKVYEGLNQMTGLSPLNPMDVRAVSANLKTCTRAASDLLLALSELLAGEFGVAEALADDALSTLKAGRK